MPHRNIEVPVERLGSDKILILFSTAATGNVMTEQGLFRYVYQIGTVGGHLAVEVQTPDGETITETVDAVEVLKPWITAIINEYEKIKEN